jgi:hypothetical protein
MRHTISRTPSSRAWLMIVLIYAAGLIVLAGIWNYFGF